MQLQTTLDNCLIEGENSTLITSAPCTVNVGQLRGLIQEGELDAIHVRLLDLTEAHVSPTNQTKSREISTTIDSTSITALPCLGVPTPPSLQTF